MEDVIGVPLNFEEAPRAVEGQFVDFFEEDPRVAAIAGPVPDWDVFANDFNPR